MLAESKKVFDVYVDEKGFNKNRIAVIEGVYKKLIRWEISKNKSIINASKEELVDLCQTGTTKIANRSYGALKTRIEAINDILKWLKLDTKLSMTDFNTHEILTDDKIRYFTREEMQDVCNIFINPQDKFIVYSLFCGLYGKGYKDLLELKVTDIDLENRVIKAPSGHIIEMDDYLLDIARDTIDPIWGSTYYKYMTNETEGTTTSEYKLNMNCEYVLKSKPYSKNDNGMMAMKLNGLQRRLLKLSEVSGVTLSGTDIYRSGLMDRMYHIELQTGDSWTCASLGKWLKENEIKAQVFELYRLYKIKYGNQIVI